MEGCYSKLPRVVGLRPLDVTGIFKDREDHFAQLCSLLRDQSAKLICVVGRAGIGKTALVCKLCSQLESGQLHSEHAPTRVEPEGIVYVDCQEGSSPILERLFLAVGRLLGGSATEEMMSCWCDSSQLLIDKLGFFFSRLQQKPCLLVLDNFERLLADNHTLRDEQLKVFVDICLQSPHSVRVIATSRKRLTIRGSAVRSARVLLVESGLPEPEGIALMRDLDPDGRLGLREAPEALLREAVRRCLGLPRGLEAIAGILDSDPALSLEALLASSDLFDGEVVENLIAEHYERLTGAQCRVLEALAVYGAPVSAQAVHYLVKAFYPDIDMDDCLRSLVRAYVVTYRRGHDMYQLHPLDQQYAYTRIPDDGQGYTKRACHCCAAEFYRRIRKPREQWHSIEDIDPQLREFEHLVRAEMFDQACVLVNEVDYDYLFRWGFFERIVQLRSCCLDKLTDPALQVDNLAGLGLANHFLGSEDEAAECHTRALQLAMKRGDPSLQISPLNGLGLVFYVRGQMKEAVDCLQQAVETAQRLHEDRKESRALSNLGLAYLALGEYQRATDCLECSLRTAREGGNRWEEGIRLSNLGAVYYDQLDVRKAQMYYEEALSIAREVRDRKGEAVRLCCLGRTHHALGHVDKAKQHYSQASRMSYTIGHRRWEANALIWLGRASLDLGQPEEAIQYYELALQEHRASQYRFGESTSLGELSHACHVIGDTGKAIRVCGDALVIARAVQSRKLISELLLQLATAHHHLGHHDDAAKGYQEALSLEQPSTNYICAVKLGLLWLEQGKKRDARTCVDKGIRFCNKLLDKTPDLHHVRFARALGQLATGEVDNAIMNCRGAVAVCGASGIVREMLDDLDLLARIPERIADSQRVAQLLKEVLPPEMDPADRRPGGDSRAPRPCRAKPAMVDRNRPDELEKVLHTIRELEKVKRLDTYSEMVGKSESIRALVSELERMESTNANVLILGETGVGKDLVAHAIHRHSTSGKGPFVRAQIAGVTDVLFVDDELFGHVTGGFTGAVNEREGKFELAQGGTIFLDEIGDLPMASQMRLLRVLETHQFERVGGNKPIEANARVVAATNQVLETMVVENRFREDLYYRLNVLSVTVPPLREHKEDIPFLVEHFLANADSTSGRRILLSDEALAKLLLYDWPGNVRELRGCLERAKTSVQKHATGDRRSTIMPSDVTFTGLRAKPLAPNREELEKGMIEDAIQSTPTFRKAAAKLEMSPDTLYKRIAKYGIPRARDRSRRFR